MSTASRLDVVLNEYLAREQPHEITSIIGNELQFLSKEMGDNEPWSLLLSDPEVETGTQLFGLIVCLLPKLNDLILSPSEELVISDFIEDGSDRPGSLFYPVGGFRSLTKVSLHCLYGSNQDMVDFDNLANSLFLLPSLEEFYGEGLFRVDNDDNIPLLPGTSFVKDLWLENCRLDTKCLEEIIRACKDLRKLTISMIDPLSLPELGDVLRATPSLEEFDLESDGIDQTGQLGSLSSLPNLTSVGLSCSTIVFVDENEPTDISSTSEALALSLPQSLKTLAIHMDLPMYNDHDSYLILHQLVQQKQSRLPRWTKLQFEMPWECDEAEDEEMLKKACNQESIVIVDMYGSL